MRETPPAFRVRVWLGKSKFVSIAQSVRWQLAKSLYISRDLFETVDTLYDPYFNLCSALVPETYTGANQGFFYQVS